MRRKPKKTAPAKRDPYARELEKAIYRQRRINSAKVYNRKKREEV
jgi:hypothetical protein